MSSNEANQLFIIRLLNWLLVATVVLFAGATYYVNMLEQQRQSAHDTFSPYEVSAAVSQAANEYFRFEHALALYALSPSPSALEEARLRLDIVISRMQQFDHDASHIGSERLVVQFLQNNPTHAAMVKTVTAALADADATLNGSEEPSPLAVENTIADLARFNIQMSGLSALASNHSAALYYNAREELARIDQLSDWLNTILISCAGLLVLVLATKLRLLDRTQVKLQQLAGRLTRTMEELRVQNTRFDAALNNMPQALSMFDENGSLAVFNRRFSELVDLPPKTLQGMHANRIRELASPTYRFLADALAPYSNTGTQHDLITDLKAKQSFTLSQAPLENGGWLTTFADISELRSAQMRIAHMALHDALTDLPNRAFFRRQLNEAMEHARTSEGGLVFYFLDFDKFKDINDTLGHQVGDELLRAVAGRMTTTLPDGYFLARFGGDEFAILAKHDLAEDHHAFCGWLIDQLSRPYHLTNHELRVGVSIGVALWTTHEDITAEELIRRADVALYQAKADGRSRARFYIPQFDETRLRNAKLEHDLALALENGEMSIAYQPIIDTVSGVPASYEALARWRHPEFGPISPAVFVSLAENNNAIFALGEWVLLQACTQAATWSAEVSVSVNVSPVQFRDPALVYKISDVLQRTGLSPSRLILEITETAFLSASETTMAMLKRLKKMGIKFSMDDFGTGYSSLHSLLRFPYDKIKIDQSFIRELPQSQDARAVVDLVIQLTKKLNIATTAEGVETEEQLACLTELLCPQIQGYLISEPKPLYELAPELQPPRAHGSDESQLRA